MPQTKAVLNAHLTQFSGKVLVLLKPLLRLKNWLKSQGVTFNKQGELHVSVLCCSYVSVSAARAIAHNT